MRHHRSTPNPLLIPELREAIANGDSAELREFLTHTHPQAVADFLAALEPAEVVAVLKPAPPATRAEVFTHLDAEIQLALIELMPRDELGRLLSDMPPDDRVDLLRQLPPDRRETLLPAMAQAEREDVRRLMSYPEGTAGAIMTSEYATLSPDETVADALARLRREAPDKETIYYSYVIDNQRRLLGSVSLKDLILARPDARVRDIMSPDPIAARVTDDQETAARTIQKYDLIALPVVDESQALVGIITHDDAADVLTQEQTEDVEKLMGISGQHESYVYMKTTPLEHFRNRVGWVLGLAALGLVSGFIVQRFEALLAQVALLATFMPMLADTGGNTGSQSATLVIRALALGEIVPRDSVRVLVREFLTALLLAVVLGLFAFGRVMLFHGGRTLPPGVTPIGVGVAIACALGIQVVTST
ncbi:MAG: magnesium transporter, partial [candidate division WOR-3 bacterium]